MSPFKCLAVELRKLDLVSLIMLPGVLALLIADDLDAEEQEILGVIMSNTGTFLSNIAVYTEAHKLNQEQDSQQQIDQLRKENREIKKLLEDIQSRFKS